MELEDMSVKYGWGTVDRCAFTLCGAAGVTVVRAPSVHSGVVIWERRAMCAEHAADYAAAYGTVSA